MTATIEPHSRAAGFMPETMSARVFVRCYRRYGDAKRAYDQLRVVGHIPDKRMTVVARGLEWRETLSIARLYKLACGVAALSGAAAAFALWLVGLTSGGTDWLTQTALGASVGVAGGFLVASVVARLRNHRGIAETGHVEPRQYDILVEEDFVPVARRVLESD